MRKQKKDKPNSSCGLVRLVGSLRNSNLKFLNCPSLPTHISARIKVGENTKEKTTNWVLIYPGISSLQKEKERGGSRRGKDLDRKLFPLPL